jgi:hypothetical protein
MHHHVTDAEQRGELQGHTAGLWGCALYAASVKCAVAAACRLYFSVVCATVINASYGALLHYSVGD